MITAKQRSGQMLQNQCGSTRITGGPVQFMVMLTILYSFGRLFFFLLTVALNALNLDMLYIREEIMIVAIRKTILNANFFL